VGAGPKTPKSKQVGGGWGLGRAESKHYPSYLTGATRRGTSGGGATKGQRELSPSTSRGTFKGEIRQVEGRGRPGLQGRGAAWAREKSSRLRQRKKYGHSWLRRARTARDWLLDSGATYNVTPYASDFTGALRIPRHPSSALGMVPSSPVAGMGIVQVLGKKWMPLTLTRVALGSHHADPSPLGFSPRLPVGQGWSSMGTGALSTGTAGF